MPDPAGAPNPTDSTTVTVGLLDGRMVSGRILSTFSPYTAQITLEALSGREPRATATLEGKRAAYIAFHREPEEPLPPNTGLELSHFNIEVATGEVFDVTCSLPTVSSGVGFFGVPTSALSPFKRVFFYTQGVKKKQQGDLVLNVFDNAKTPIEAGFSKKSDTSTSGSSSESAEDIGEALSAQLRRRMRLGEVLVDLGMATTKDIDTALGLQRQKPGKRLGELLVEMGVLTEAALFSTLARKFNLPQVDLDSQPIDPDAVAEVPAELLRRFNFLPIQTNQKQLTIAIGDPLAHSIHDVLRFQSKKRIIEVLATPSQLRSHIELQLRVDGGTVGQILQDLSGDEGEEAEAEQPEELATTDSAVVRLVNQIIIDAQLAGASDIHIEPNGGRNQAQVRFRVDGDCQIYQQIPAMFVRPVVARLKILGKVDISERRKPQDGKITLRPGTGRPIELRLATLPTIDGNEDVILRLLPESKALPLEDLQMSANNLRMTRSLISSANGLFLCVGPTGSGKTSTLHALLNAINTVDMKICTAEDPVEIVQIGLRQLQINQKIGLTFAAAIRAFLRADPDVIMIGEMRDLETANIAVEASLTGHLVFSTLHTNSAPETIGRLLDMGLDPFSFSDGLRGVLAQRLVRALCLKCRERYSCTAEERALLVSSFGEEQFYQRFGTTTKNAFQLWRAKGCGSCKTGYRGRIGIHELLQVTPAIRSAIQHKASSEELRTLASAAGMLSLIQDGVEKVLAGFTDMKQVLAATLR